MFPFDGKLLERYSIGKGKPWSDHITSLSNPQNGKQNSDSPTHYLGNVLMESFQSALNSSEAKPLCIWSSMLLFSFTITQQELGSIHSPSLIPANNSIKEMELSISQIIICSNCYFPQTVALPSLFSFFFFNYTLTALK